MNFSDDFIKQVKAKIAALPEEDRADAIHAMISDMIKTMPNEGIYEMRKSIVSEFEPGIPVVEETLELIDGQLALREIAGKDTWR